MKLFHAAPPAPIPDVGMETTVSATSLPTSGMEWSSETPTGWMGTSREQTADFPRNWCPVLNWYPVRTWCPIHAALYPGWISPIDIARLTVWARV
ncbi:MAG: hypothetical protein HPY85_17630 [Anaerolineae bacterium]|nr:hypothetical protein [Anaerolineae bacterium]